MLADDSSSNQFALAKNGGMPLLIMWLSGGLDNRSFNADAQKEAARGMLSLSANNSQLQLLMAKSNGIPPLIELVSKGSLETKEYATRTLWHLAGNSAVGEVIAQAGGLIPLVSMLSNDDVHAQELAAVVISRLASSNPNVSLTVAEAGGVPPLVRLVKGGSTAAQQQAAAALAEVGLAPANRDLIAEAGGIPPLVALLSSKVVGTPETAARALAHLARDGRETPDDGGAPPDEPAEVREDEDTVGRARSKAPAVDKARLMGHGVLTVTLHKGVKLMASDEGADGSRPTSDPYVVVRSGSQFLRSKPVMGTVNPTFNEELVMSGSLNEFVTAGLRLELFDYDDVSADDPLAADDPLGDCSVTLDAFKFQNDVVEFEEALSTKGKLLFSARWDPIVGKPGEARRQMIAAAGGVKQLVNMLQATPIKNVARRMWELVAGVIGLSASAAKAAAEAADASSSGSDSEAIGIQEQAAATLSDLAYGDLAMQNAVIDAQGVSPLLTLLRIGSPLAQEKATRAIWHLCASTDNQGVIVEAGAISELVSLSKTGTSQAQELAAAVISDLAKGAIVEREKMMKTRATTPDATDNTKRFPLTFEVTIDIISDEQNDVRVHIANLTTSSQGPDSPAIQPSVIGIATDADEPPQLTRDVHEWGTTKDAAHSVDRTHSAGDEAVPKDRLSAIASAGGIVPLVGLVTNGAPLSKERAASALWHLSVDAVNQFAISKAGGLAPIAQLLDDGTEQAAIFASEALDRLSLNNSDNQNQIAKKLVSLLGSKDFGAQQRSAHALRDLAQKHPGASVRIVNAGAISPLVALLGHGSIEAKEEAVGALSCLAQNDPHNQLAIATGLVALLGSGSAEGQEHVTRMLIKFAEAPDNRAAIAEAGAIERLIIQITDSDNTSLKVQELAAVVLATLSGDSDENVSRIVSSGGIRPLITLLGSSSAVAQANGAAVLADLCARTPLESTTPMTTPSSNDNQTSVAREGAIDALVALLSDESTRDSPEVDKTSMVHAKQPLVVPSEEEILNAKSEAAGALWSISCSNPEMQLAIAASGAVLPLVKLLKESDPDAQMKAAGALGSLAIRSAPNQSIIADAGGIQLLVRLLSEHHGDTVHAKAAKALAELTSGHASNQHVVAEAGGIPLIVELLHGDVEEEVKTEGARALWSFSHDHPANKEAIAHAGGITPLVKLIGEGGVQAQTEAAAALASIALDNPLNEEDIANKLVNLLSTPARRAATNAARAMASLARANASNQGAIARAGGVPPLVDLLQSTTPHLKRRGTALSAATESNADSIALINEVVSAIWATAHENPSNQAKIADQGAIPLLIALLLQRDSPEVYRNAAGALWSLGAAETNQECIAKEHGIVPLIALLNDRGTPAGALETSAGALRSLAALNENRVAIASSGGIPALAQLFENGTLESKEEAAGALAALVIGNRENQSAVAHTLVSMLASTNLKAPELAKEHITRLLHTLSEDAENRGPLSKAGAILQLAEQLNNGTSVAQANAASALSQIALKSPEHRVQVTQQLVTLLGSEVDAVRQRAATALKAMAAKGGADTRMTVMMAGGIDRFVSLLKDGSVEAQEYALWLLWQVRAFAA